MDDQSNEKLIRLDARPLYVRVQEALEHYLDNFESGDKLPSEAELSRILGVSRATLREALRTLEERGRIESRQGVGTFITNFNPIMDTGLETLESLVTLAKKKGFECKTDHVIFKRQPADLAIATHLGIEEGTPAITITRNQSIANSIMAYMFDVVPASIVDFEKFQADFTGSVLDYLNTHLPAPPTYAKTTLHAIQADSKLAKEMQVPEGTALLLMEEELYSSENQVVNYSLNYYITSHFRFQITRTKL